MTLKSEMVKMRANADKDRIKIRQLESSGKRFDPSKSFSHNKENRDKTFTAADKTFTHASSSSSGSKENKENRDNSLRPVNQ